MADDILTTLLGATGRYTGTSGDPEGDHPDGQATIDVREVPGGSGVAIEFTVDVDGRETHAEHTMLVRTPAGLLLLVTHTHADVATTMVEGDPGSFAPPAGEAPPFPMAIRIEAPEAGRLVYSWSYGFGDEPLRVRDVAQVRRDD